MIRIFKDRDNKFVTRGAYETFYKPLGYQVVIEEKKAPKAENKTTVEVTEPKEEEVTRVVSNKNKREYHNDLQDSE